MAITEPQPAGGVSLAGAAPQPERPLPTIGVDPGQTWTAACLRVGDYGEHGWTIGPVDKYGTLRRDALNEVDDWQALRRYIARLMDGLETLVEYAIDKYGEVRVGVEVPLVPVGWRPGSVQKFQRMPMRDWIVPREVASAVLGGYPEAKVIVPDGYGARPAAMYPKELRGTRPPDWGPNEVPNHERDHERAAYDIAGAAAREPR